MNLTLPLSGSAMAAAAIPILLVLMMVLAGVVLVAVGRGIVHKEVRSHSTTLLGISLLLGAAPASRAPGGMPFGLLVGGGSVILVGILIVLGCLVLLAKAS